jgi:aconitase B
MITTITDTLGNVYEYNSDNGLISRNDIVLSGSDYEPVFATYLDNSEPPIFVGIYSKRMGTVLSMSGKTNKIINSRSL